MSGRASALAAGLTAVAVAASICAPLAGAKPKHKPDLVVSHLKFDSLAPNSSAKYPSVLLSSSGVGLFGYSFTIKNIGRKPAPKSHAAVYISDRRIATARVEPLAAGDGADFGQDTHSAFGSPGLDQLYVCADQADDVNESNEGNNCSRHIHFAVIPKRWNASQFSTTLHDPNGGPSYAAHSVGMHFDFLGTKPNNNQYPVYEWLASGAEVETASGLDSSGCTLSGNGNVTHLPWGVNLPPNMGLLEIGADLRHYDAYVADENYTYVVTATCPDPNQSYTGPAAIEALGTDPDAGFLSQAMPETATTLAGTWGNSIYGGLWQFKADVPPKATRSP